jgi:uncharacterized protein
MNDAPSALLDLQVIDRARDRLREQREKLPERAQLAEIEARLVEVKAAAKQLEREITELELAEKETEEEVRLIEEKVAQEEHKMYSGEVINPKELQALQDEVRLLNQRKEPLEDKGIEQLEKRDELIGQRGRLADEVADLEKEAEDIRRSISEAEGKIDGEMSTEEGKRADVVVAIPSDTIELYEEIRSSKRGVGVGALEGDTCTACRESLSAVEVDKIKRKAREGEWLFRCEHCRRLLVVR